MEPAVFIARVIGPLFVVLGAGILLNWSLYAAMIAEAVRIPTFIYLSGILTFTAGAAILNCYRAWTAGWRVIVTVLGWVFLIAGVIRIVLPRLTMTLATALYSGTAALAIAGVIVLILGAFLSFKAYRA
jgi:hypothetical protein